MSFLSSSVKPLIAVACLALTTAAIADDSPLVWFDQIDKPTDLTQPQLESITQNLYKALKNNQPIDTILTSVPIDESPRIIFISIGDDAWPARTYFGTGLSLQVALQNAVTILKANETAKEEAIVKQANSIIQDAQKANQPPPQSWVQRKKNPSKWSWLKLQVVQATKPVLTFTIDNSAIRFTDTIGLAFGPSMGFSFTPDQLTGRFLINPNGTIAKQQIGNIIAETYNFPALSIWMQLANATQEQQITLFEVDTYFTDGNHTQRLFRGHPIQSLPSATDCKNAAISSACAIMPLLNPKNGHVRKPFLEWHRERGNRDAIEDMAELIMALKTAAQITENSHFQEAALLAHKAIERTITQFGKNKEYTAVISKESLPKDSMRSPRSIAVLHENAMAFIVSHIVSPDNPNSDQRRNHAQFIQFLAELTDDDGPVAGIALQDNKYLHRRANAVHEKLLDRATASYALDLAAELFNDNAFAVAADKQCNMLIDIIKQCPPQSTFALDPWIAMALCKHLDHKDKRSAIISQLAGTILTAPKSPAIQPDTLGASADSDDYTPIARRAWTTSIIANWFFDNFNTDFANAILAANAIPTAFHIQALIELPTASALACPKEYMGFFRASPHTFSFSLKDQTSQILALVTCSKLLTDHGVNGAFPEAEAAQAQLANATKLINMHPSYINAPSVISHAAESGQPRHSTFGNISEPTQDSSTQRQRK